MTIVHKGDGDLRFCLDPKDLNDSIKRQHFQMPTFEDISSKLAGSSVFSILDTKDAFMHVKLSKESSGLCVFNTMMHKSVLSGHTVNYFVQEIGNINLCHVLNHH